MGMANEFTLGMHGRLKFEEDKLAGQYPRKQVKTCEKAGVNSFGAVINTNSSRSFAWNLARSVTYVKEAVKAADIPVLVDVGMGVGGFHEQLLTDGRDNKSIEMYDGDRQSRRIVDRPRRYIRHGMHA